MTDTVQLPEHIVFARDGRLFRVDVDMPMPASKAQAIQTMIEKDAGDAVVDIHRHKRLHVLTASGFITPSTMRQMLQELAR